jgi:DNA processing protein
MSTSAERPTADAQSAAGVNRTAQPPSACAKCLRRAALLELVNDRLEYLGRDPERLAILLELSDEQLLQALGGAESTELRERYEAIDLEQAAPPGVERICRHDPRYPPALVACAGGPRMLHVAGGVARLQELLREPAVAIVGTRAASDYGLETAYGLARDLAASGVTVIAGLADGIAAAAHTGALDAGGPTLTVMAGGVDTCRPASRRELHRRLLKSGCAVAELPCGSGPGGWHRAARSRIVVALARVVVVVEASERRGELVPAQLARAMNRTLAATPGRVTSPLAAGPHALLREGALLVRGAQDVLDALYGVGTRRAAKPPRDRATRERAALEPELRTVLDRVGAGQDTLPKLVASGAGERETLVALAKLELAGHVVRGDAGRYLARL